MSKERELLVRIYRFFKSNVENDFGLGSDIRELLTQPEPIKEREVSGKIVSTDDSCNWNLTVAALKDYDRVYVNGIRYTEYQPDINTQYLLDQVSRLTSENAMLKEKWLAQPEQEPVAWMQDSIELYVREEKDIVRGYVIPLYTAPPKREPLRPLQLLKLMNKYELRIDLMRAVEKYHGIIGVAYE